MNFKSLLVALATLSTVHVSAQSTTKSKPFSRFTQKHTHGNNTASKSTATLSRLIAVAGLQYSTTGSSFEYTDSSHVSYSGQRGGDLTTLPIKFDEGISWVNNGSGLENDAMFFQTFDGNDNIITTLSQDWNGSAYVNSSGTVSTFDGNNNELTNTEIYWNGSSWDSTYKYTYTYDVNNKLLSEIGVSWNGTMWVNEYAYTFDLDVNGNAIASTYSVWNLTAWDSTGKELTTYNVNNLPVDKIYQSWNGTAWDNDNRHITTYDVNNVVLTFTIQNWNSAWVNYRLITNTIVNGDIVNELDQHWDGSAWENFRLLTTTFDGNHNNILQITQFWQGAAWDNSMKADRTYNSFNQETSEKYIMWDGAAWVNEDGDYWTRFYYETYTTGVNDITATEKAFTIYPVPATNSITIEKTWDNARPFSVSVIDMQGRLIASYSEKGAVNYKRTIDVSNLATGNYMVKLAPQNGKVSYQQFVVTH